MGLAPPAPVIESVMSEKEKKEGRGEIIEYRAAVDQASREVFEVFAGIDVVKELSGGKSIAIDHGDESKEVMNEEKANRDYPCHNLAGGEGGCEAADGNEERAHEEKEKERSKQGSRGEDRGRIRQKPEKVELNKAGNQEEKIEAKGGRILSQDKLPGLHRGGEEGFESAATFFLCKKTHGDQWKNGEKIEPEVAGVEYMKDQAFSSGGVLQVLHR